jgi:hypothetical protein
MKVLRFVVVFVLAIAIGSAIGFAVRRQTRSVIQERTGNARIAAGQQSRNQPNKLAGPNEGGAQPEVYLSAAAKLERALATSKGVVQWLHWMEAIEKASLADMPRLAQLAGKNQTALRLVAARWLELNPRNMFDYLVKGSESGGFGAGPLEEILLNDWAKKDPQALIKALDEAPAFGTRDRWRTTVAGRVIENDAELGLKLMARWHIDHYIPNMNGVAKWAAKDPQHAAEFVLSTGPSTVTQEAIKTVGKEWAKIDPSGALEFATEKRGDLSSALSASVLQSWAKQDLKQATDWLASADRSTRNRLSPAVVEVWAEKDPASALIWTETNLTGSSLSQAAASVLKGAADKDIAAAARLVSVMQPSSARAAGALSVAEKWLPNLGSENAPKPEALQWLQSLDPESVRTVLERTFSTWAQSEPRSLAEFLKTTPIEHIPAHIYAYAARNFARYDPAKAIEWASGTPDYARAEAGGDAFAEWRRAQPEAAMEWWNALPADDPRRKSFFESAVRNLAWDPLATEQFGALAALDQASAREVLAKMGLTPERRSALLQAMGGTQ